MVVTTETIFHPQGGGQPTDVGTISSTDDTIKFDVTSARQDAIAKDFTVLHLGRYSTTSTREFQTSDAVQQTLDMDKRTLYSRLHTAGHVLGLAVRHYLESLNLASNIIDAKASHFPDMANVEFIGSIDGKHKAGIQAKVNEYVSACLPIEICQWNAEELKDPKNRVYMPENSAGEFGMEEGGSLRCVSVVGKGAYPCGGTHVQHTGLCGKIMVYKITRSKGVTRVSYSLD